MLKSPTGLAARMCAINSLIGRWLGVVDDAPNAAVNKILHHLRVRLHGRIGIEVAGLKGTQTQPIGSERRDVECGHFVTDQKDAPRVVPAAW